MKKGFRLSRNLEEPIIWLMGTGLLIGVLMILALLTLVTVKGVDAFWPKNLVQIESKEGTFVVGEIWSKHRINKASEKQKKEFRLFTGSKEVYGQPFRILKESEFLKYLEPKELMAVVRNEYGNAFLIPLSLKLSHYEEIFFKGNQKQFDTKLNELIKIIKKHESKIESLEKGKIRKIRHKLTRYEDKTKRLNYFAKKGGSKPKAEKIAIYQAKIKQLNEDYLLERKKSDHLKREFPKASLNYRLVSGEKFNLPLKNLVSYYYPNQLNWGQKLLLFGKRVSRFIFDNPREANTEGGIFPAIFGTFLMTILMSIFVMPFGVIAAIYLREYAKQGVVIRLVRICVNNLAGVPSIVFGLFGLGFFIYFIGGGIDSLFYPWRETTPTWGKGGLIWASLTLALLTLPVVIVTTEETFSALGKGMREAAMASGASKWQMIQRVLLPAAAPGMMTGLILAMARGAGEVAPLILVGVVKSAPELPMSLAWPFGLNQSFMHMGFHIYDLSFQSPDSEVTKPLVFVTTLLLILVVLTLNIAAIYLRSYLKKRHRQQQF